MIEFDSEIKSLHRIGQATAGKLKKLGLKTARDLLWYVPRDYQDFSVIKPIAELKVNEITTVKGTVELITNRRSRIKRMSITECMLSDDTGSIKIIWFNQPYLKKQIQSGDQIFVSGKITDEYFTLQYTNPLWEKVKTDTLHTARIIPIYPLTQGLTQKQLRFLIKQVLPLANKIRDYLPNEILHTYHLSDLTTALEQIHWPKDREHFMNARNRLKFDELLMLQLFQEKHRLDLMKTPARRISFQQEKVVQLVTSLPFTLTDDQRRAAWEILKDLDKEHPMNRLLQGDVGSGKTVVAAIACLNVALAHGQAAILAPTEILAMQHWNTFKTVLKEFDIPMALMTRSNKETNESDGKKNTKKHILMGLADNTISIIIGTHALLQEQITFSQLDLIIVDEQHRFGVDQRHKLKDASPQTTPHFLSMTATPIPRTLSLALFGDLDISFIKQKPPGRKPVITKLIDADKRADAYSFIRKKIQSKEQAFVICPLIEESDTLGIKAAETEYQKLTKKIFPDLTIGLLHGRLKADDKQAVMNDFTSGKLDILVSTSVVEVGVDVPRATIMMIEGAERFGLAQLHQFRGRVGRSDMQSYCFLFTDNANPQITKRLRAVTETTDGMRLAEYDLKMRGAGEIYGTRQSGLPDLKIATLYDFELMKQAKNASHILLTESPDLSLYPLLKKKYEYNSQKIYIE